MNFSQLDTKEQIKELDRRREALVSAQESVNEIIDVITNIQIQVERLHCRRDQLLIKLAKETLGEA